MSDDTKVAAIHTGRYRPMVSAPKDGTAVLALLEGSDIPLPVRWRGQMDPMATKGSGWYVTWDNFKLSVHDGPRGWVPIPTEWLPEMPEVRQALTPDTAPIGTRAPAHSGGYWTRVDRGWRWCTGGTFPRPGGATDMGYYKRKPPDADSDRLPWYESRQLDTVQTSGNPATRVTPEKLREWAKEPKKGTPMVPIHQATLLELADLLEQRNLGWLRAAVAWGICASIHRTYAEGKDALFHTRQAGFARHEATARATAGIEGPVDDGAKNG